MDTKAQMIHQLINIENAAILGYIPGCLTALTASLLRLELMDSETEIDALERAEQFIDSISLVAA